MNTEKQNNSKLQKARIFSSPDKCMNGIELKRLREAAGMTQQQLADKMALWGWYREKVIILEHKQYFALFPDEMQSLLDALGASSI
jgi:hypothetical protein